MCDSVAHVFSLSAQGGEEVREVDGQVFPQSMSTGVTVDQRRYFVDTLREGRIVRLRMFSEQRDALEAVGCRNRRRELLAVSLDPC